MRKEWFLRVLYENKQIVLYAFLFLLGLFLMWFVMRMYAPASAPDTSPTPFSQYQ